MLFDVFSVENVCRTEPDSIGWLQFHIFCRQLWGVCARSMLLLLLGFFLAQNFICFCVSVIRSVGLPVFCLYILLWAEGGIKADILLQNSTRSYLNHPNKHFILDFIGSMHTVHQALSDTASQNNDMIQLIVCVPKWIVWRICLLNWNSLVSEGAAVEAMA